MLGLVAVSLIFATVLIVNVADSGFLASGAKDVRLALVVGYSTVLFVSFIFDKNYLGTSFVLKAMILPLAIFMAGVVTGTLANTLMQIELNFYSFFLKPIAIFGIYGGPLALTVGVIWYFINWAFGRSKT